VQLLVVFSALMVDTVAGRNCVVDHQFGFTPNRGAALGENPILLRRLLNFPMFSAIKFDRRSSYRIIALRRRIAPQADRITPLICIDGDSHL
jgi:hypothetical protein